MKALKEIKEVVAKELFYPSFNQFQLNEDDEFERDIFYSLVARRYAEQAIERCAEVAEYDHFDKCMDREGILNVKTELK